MQYTRAIGQGHGGLGKKSDFFKIFSEFKHFDGFTNFFGRVFRSRSSGIDSMSSRTSSIFNSRKLYYPEDHEIVDFSTPENENNRLSCPEFNPRITEAEQTENQNRLSAPCRLPGDIQRY